MNNYKKPSKLKDVPLTTSSGTEFLKKLLNESDPEYDKMAMEKLSKSHEDAMDDVEYYRREWEKACERYNYACQEREELKFKLMRVMTVLEYYLEPNSGVSGCKCDCVNCTANHEFTKQILKEIKVYYGERRIRRCNHWQNGVEESL